jgi:hypothetical protein
VNPCCLIGASAAAELFLGMVGGRSVEASRVHATLGGELFDGEPVRVAGTYRGQVSEPPPVIPFWSLDECLCPPREA